MPDQASKSDELTEIMVKTMEFSRLLSDYVEKTPDDEPARLICTALLTALRAIADHHRKQLGFQLLMFNQHLDDCCDDDEENDDDDGEVEWPEDLSEVSNEH